MCLYFNCTTTSILFHSIFRVLPYSSLFLSFFFRWYFGKIKRMEAEKKLLLPQNEHGAFLIRDSESRRNDYSLSVRDGDTVKHYRIRQLDEGGFFIARRTTFRTLQELVDHYSRDADGLCVNLRKACIQVRILSQFDSREMLIFDVKDAFYQRFIFYNIFKVIFKEFIANPYYLRWQRAWHNEVNAILDSIAVFAF